MPSFLASAITWSQPGGLVPAPAAAGAVVAAAAVVGAAMGAGGVVGAGASVGGGAAAGLQATTSMDAANPTRPNVAALKPLTSYLPTSAVGPTSRWKRDRLVAERLQIFGRAF